MAYFTIMITLSYVCSLQKYHVTAKSCELAALMSQGNSTVVAGETQISDVIQQSKQNYTEIK